VSSDAAFTTEQWISSLGADDRERARQFVASYGVAYSVRRTSEVKWMLAHGFPSLVDVVEYSPDYLSQCPPLRCADPIKSALNADHLINEMEATLAREYAGGGPLPSNYIMALPADEQSSFTKQLAAATNYINNARDGGSPLFAAYLRRRVGLLTSDSRSVDGATAMIAACGDRRMVMEDSQTYEAALSMVGSLPGGVAACGYRSGRPIFPL
jgi:hypothetical protein